MARALCVPLWVNGCSSHTVLLMERRPAHTHRFSVRSVGKVNCIGDLTKHAEFSRICVARTTCCSNAQIIGNESAPHGPVPVGIVAQGTGRTLSCIRIHSFYSMIHMFVHALFFLCFFACRDDCISFLSLFVLACRDDYMISLVPG